MVSLADSPVPKPAPSRWPARWRAFRRPIAEEKAQVPKERWDSLPLELRTNNQISGRHLTHCGFTLGASYCSFHCTHCYLPKNANEIPIPSLAQVKVNRSTPTAVCSGPGGGLQITGGDVADAYWKSGRGDELIEIVRYAVLGWIHPDADDAWADLDRATAIPGTPHGGGRVAANLRPRRHDAGGPTRLSHWPDKMRSGFAPGATGVYRSCASRFERRPGCSWSMHSVLRSRAATSMMSPK